MGSQRCQGPDGGPRVNIYKGNRCVFKTKATAESSKSGVQCTGCGKQGMEAVGPGW